MPVGYIAVANAAGHLPGRWQINRSQNRYGSFSDDFSAHCFMALILKRCCDNLEFREIGQVCRETANSEWSKLNTQLLQMW